MFNLSIFNIFFIIPIWLLNTTENKKFHSGMELFAWRGTLNYAYSLFNFKLGSYPLLVLRFVKFLYCCRDFDKRKQIVQVLQKHLCTIFKINFLNKYYINIKFLNISSLNLKIFFTIKGFCKWICCRKWFVEDFINRA